MNKVFWFISLFTVFSFFFLISVAGENSRTDSIVDEFVTNLKNENFSRECIKIITNNSQESDLSCEQDMFIFTLSLLKRFELLDASNFYINLRRENYWVPFVNNQGVRVSLNLSKTE